MKELIKEYRKSCSSLENHIGVLEEKLTTARGKEAFSLEKRIALIKEEILDLKHILNYLILTYGE